MKSKISHHEHFHLPAFKIVSILFLAFIVAASASFASSASVLNTPVKAGGGGNGGGGNGGGGNGGGSNGGGSNGGGSNGGGDKPTEPTKPAKPAKPAKP